ncbi:T9SS type B sorting domain-containing protein [Winogradskyella tangerina]|uniref:T9SS type B sorting domain-containing protein n=1 Tax=Winogradskyella tangerina TaxID=2023240 RepID=UPI000DBE7AAC|nr:T9SS type B sorting domain-containing protein [Winogradskyella tangerina]
MKKPTFSKALIALLAICFSVVTYAQNYVPFTPRFNEDLKGDIVLIGNNILGPNNDPFNDGSVYNHNVDMQYIDIDGDPTTFSSSSADLEIPNPNCYQIIYAGLYWGAVNPGAEPITEVRFRGPSGGYNDVTGTVIFDANGSTIDGGDSFSYACFADVTDIVTSYGQGNDLGTYTVANVSSGLGETANFTPYNGTGQSAGWSLFIVYEDPTLPGKSITSFDGFSAISVPGGNPNLDIPVDGFRTVPAPAPVRANFAFATLEGDSPILGDRLRLNGVSLSTTDRPVANFFNSSVTRLDATPVNNRVPNSTNTLGFDTGTIAIPNPGNSVIANDATNGVIRLETSGDTYFPYFFAFAVEIIEPDIVLTKIVEDDAGNDIGGQLVGLGAPLNYVIGFQNIGNDNATNFQIRDVLPINIIYNHPTDLILPPGVTVASYDPITRELIFDIDNSLVEEDDPRYEIRIEVQVVDTCGELADACSNIINNQAFATYNGFFNPTFQITDDPSLNSNTGCLLSPQATNFLADLDCEFIEEIVLCGDTVELTAANGYDSYTWSTSPSGTPVIGNTQTITVDATGTYYSFNNAIAPCQSIEQVFEVELFGGDIQNPVIPYADEVVTCPNDGKLLPNIFLCGANDSRFIQTNISDSISIIWEQLDESSCAAVSDPDCANEDPACTWNEVATGSDFLADTAGQFRLTINYPGGCFNQFYFNVYQNLLVPTVVSTDIICATNGSITVNDVPSGYEYSIDGVNFQTSNVFTITTPGTYSVYVRQIGVPTNPCIFSVPDVLIRDRNFTVTSTISQPLCYGELGSIQLAANDVDPQYTFTLSEGGTLVNTVGPIMENTYLFDNLNPGTYTATVETENGCFYSEDVTITEPPLLTVTAALTTPLTCTEGEITIYPEGGTPPYFYFINGSTDFQTVPTITVTAPGTFDILVVDANNCSANTTITVDQIPTPEFNITTTDILCGGTGDTGTITIDVTNPNGNSISYSIDGGVNFSNSNIFTGLVAGDYDVVLEYSSGASVCITTPQTVTIIENTAISGTAELTSDFTCNGTGSITVTGVSGGNPPYEYSIDGVNFQASNVFTGLTQGTYSITIRDTNICTAVTNDITIDPLDPPTDMDFANTPVVCPALTSDVTITNVVGGSGVLEYQIIAPATAVTPYQASNVFTGLAPDTYTFQVRDENDCTYTESYTIDPIPTPTIDVVLTEGLDCTATPDAEITGTITGTAPYSYEVSYNGAAYASVGSTGATFTYNTAIAGTYQFLITDANGCTAESSIVTVNPISPPAFSAIIESQPILCNGDANGAIDITIDTSVGNPPFTINVNNDITGTDYGTQTTSLPAGTYTITITDANSCATTDTIIISEPDAINFDLSKVDITCSNPGGSSLGSITVENIVGGTAPFTYYISNNFGDVIPGNPYVAASNEDHTFNIINFGVYTVNVVDANGCSMSQQIVMASPPSDLIIDVNIAVPDCTTGGVAEVTAVSAVGSGSYEFGILEFNTIPYTSTFFPPDTPGGNVRTFTNLIPGVVYTFVVHDLVTDCYFVKSADFAIDPASTLTSTVQPNNVTCTSTADGSVTFTIDDFDVTTTSVDYSIYSAFDNQLVDGPFNVPVTFGVPETVTTAGNLSPGQYYLVFTENGTGSFNGCNTASQIFEILESPVPLDLTVSVDQNANCNPNSGVISAIGQNGTAPYQYQITTTPAAPLATDTGWDSASTFNVDAGSYYIHVLDAFGCIVSSPVTIVDQDDSPVISATLSNACEITDGNYEINVNLDTPGTAPYSFSINGGAFQTQTTPFTISNLFAGTHTIEIQDANGCGNTISIDIDGPIDITPEVTALPSCNNDDGEITVTGSGGSGSYAYSIAPNPASISLAGNIFTGVPSGIYTVIITDTVLSCTSEVTITVPEAIVPLFDLTSSITTCFGDNTGSFDINVSNFTGNYTYEVFDDLGASVTGVVNANMSTNPLTVTGMQAGTFTVEITQTDYPYCSNTGIIVISSPLEALTLALQETSNVTCNNNEGTITAIADGGWGDYEFELSGDATVAYSSNNVFSGLSAGTYTVTVRDAEGCLTSEVITLTEPAPITATFTPSTTTLACFGDQDASITVDMVSGGQGSNYTYTLNMISPQVSSSGPQTSNVFNDLGAGTYNITITDGFDCEMTSLDIVIANPTELDVDLVRASTQTCFIESTLTLSASGGTGPYEYSNTNDFTTILGSFASSTTFSVPEGEYAYYVRDANGCISNISNEITVDPLPELVVNLESSNPSINCAGDNTGSILADAQGGLGDYSYTLQDGQGNPIAATQNTPGYFTELVAGDYIVLVESGDCSAVSAPISITEPSTQLDATIAVNNVTCAGNNNGSVEITATGGTGVIQYAISPQLNQFFTTNIFENLAAGDYDLIVQDELGCYLTFNFTILDPEPVIITIIGDSFFPELCEGDANGEFSIDIDGGNMPYSVSLDNYDGPYTTGGPTQTVFDFTDLEGGDHIVYIRDAEGCESEWNITFPESVSINPELLIEATCDDNVQSNMVTVTVDDTTVDLADLDYSLNGGPYQLSNVFANVPVGMDHYISVRHTNGCIVNTEFFDIDPTEPVALALSEGELNEIIANATGGTGDYTFTMNGEDYGSENSFIISETGIYTIVVTDSNGCYAEAQIELEFVDICIPNWFTPNGDGEYDTWAPGCTENYPNLTFDIFDRYGRKVATYRVGEVWDGRYNGHELPTGDYWFVVQTNDPNVNREFVGHFTLYR